MARIHPTAVVDPAAELDADVEVGPYAVIGPQVRVAAGSRIGAHAVLSGRTTLGRENRVFPHAALGGEPQDKKYRGEDTALVIGDGNTIREFCTFNTGTAQGGGVTRVGNDNWVMAYVHVAHDVQVGDHCVLANNATLAGHSVVGDWVILGGLTGVHQFVRIGSGAMVGGNASISYDVPPYAIAAERNQIHGLNVVGLRRSKMPHGAIADLKRCYHAVYAGPGDLRERVAGLMQQQRVGAMEPGQRFLQFFAGGKRGFCRPRLRGSAESIAVE
ncbi:MAG: acyl-ACP--UDP-N-acetylglucosamine O-acyltransferase [Betaproteobacteria bacterium]